jgi:hypothetical protein
MLPIVLGICSGTEYAFPEALNTLFDWLFRNSPQSGDWCPVVAEYVREAPFDASGISRYNIVLDRISHQRPFTAEWLKKLILDGSYVINNPHHFQSRRKSYGYAAASKLGFDVPVTVLLPPKSSYVDWRNMEPAFDIVETGGEVGYPMYMKPYNGGGWRNVTRVFEPAGLKEAYALSGGEIMNIQEAVNYDYFIRSICIGSSVLPLEYDPEAYHHERYVTRGKAPASVLEYCARVSRIISGFLGFEMNSVEILVQMSRDAGESDSGKISRAYLIDFNNPVPDMSLISLHRFFPSVVREMARRVTFLGATSRKYPFESRTFDYLEIAESSLSMDEKMNGYEAVADSYFGRAGYQEYSRSVFGDHYEELEGKMFEQPEFSVIMKKEIYDTFHDHSDPGKFDRFLDNYRNLLSTSREDDTRFMI